MFERFTDGARQVVVLAQEEARLLHHNYIGTEHLLLGILAAADGVGARALATADVSLAVVRGRVEDIIGRTEAPSEAHLPFTPRAKTVIELSLRQALQLGHNHIGTGHLLLALIEEGEGVAPQILIEQGVAPADLRSRVLGMLYDGDADPPPAARTRSDRVSGPAFIETVRPSGPRPTNPGRAGSTAVTPGLLAMLFVMVTVAAAVTERPPTALGRWSLASLGGGLVAIAGAAVASPGIRRMVSTVDGSNADRGPSDAPGSSGAGSQRLMPLLFVSGVALFVIAAGLMVLDGLLA